MKACQSQHHGSHLHLESQQECRTLAMHQRGTGFQRLKLGVAAGLAETCGCGDARQKKPFEESHSKGEVMVRNWTEGYPFVDDEKKQKKNQVNSP